MLAPSVAFEEPYLLPLSQTALSRHHCEQVRASVLEDESKVRYPDEAILDQPFLIQPHN